MQKRNFDRILLEAQWRHKLFLLTLKAKGKKLRLRFFWIFQNRIEHILKRNVRLQGSIKLRNCLIVWVMVPFFRRLSSLTNRIDSRIVSRSCCWLIDSFSKICIKGSGAGFTAGCLHCTLLGWADCAFAGWYGYPPIAGRFEGPLCLRWCTDYYNTRRTSLGAWYQFQK